jgi:hypothetical protein
MAVHGQPVERPERPGVGPLDCLTVAQRAPEAQQRLLDGVIGLLWRQACMPGEAPELRSSVGLQAHDRVAQGIGSD